MKATYFYGTVKETVKAFNQWAKGKALRKDVIIHEQVTERIENCETTTPMLTIIVYHPEDKYWDITQAEEQPQKSGEGINVAPAEGMTQ